MASVVQPNVADPALALRLMIHEARAQQSLGRELRDLGDSWLLHDPSDSEPFWNRLIGPRWPADPPAFERRLDQAITLFSTLDRLAHIRPLPIGGTPRDLRERLVASGFEQVGADRRLALVDPSVCLAIATRQAGQPSARLSIDRHPARSEGWNRQWAIDASIVLAEAFDVDPIRRVALQTDVLACAARRGCSILILRDDGDPVAVARRTTVSDGSYLSSIGTRPGWRGRGYGTLVTALAVADALAAGSAIVHLAVELDNEHALAFYERLGFAVVGDPVPDLLLR